MDILAVETELMRFPETVVRVKSSFRPAGKCWYSFEAKLDMLDELVTGIQRMLGSSRPGNVDTKTFRVVGAILWTENVRRSRVRGFLQIAFFVECKEKLLLHS